MDDHSADHRLFMAQTKADESVPPWLAAMKRGALDFGRVIRSQFRPWRGGLRDVPGAILEAAAERRWTNRTKAAPHNLPKPLIISLTSYPPRFPTLALTLKCLLTQHVAADRVVLWLAEPDIAQLPPEVFELCAHGLSIEATRDIRSFKKIIPELRRSQDAFIVTADDDVYYHETWLAELVHGYQPGRHAIPAQRVHHMILNADGSPAPYTRWAMDIKPGPASPLHVATGVGGVLYPPGSLHPDVLDERLFMRLCPSNDDLWLYFQARRAGWSIRKVGPRRAFSPWPGSQKIALQHDNLALGGNDEHLAKLIGYYGAPFVSGFASGSDAKHADESTPRAPFATTA